MGFHTIIDLEALQLFLDKYSVSLINCPLTVLNGCSSTTSHEHLECEEWLTNLLVGRLVNVPVISSLRCFIFFCSNFCFKIKVAFSGGNACIVGLSLWERGFSLSK